MLGEAIKTAQDGKVATLIYVNCAKTLLDKTIGGMSTEEFIPVTVRNFKEELKPKSDKKNVPLGADDIQYEFIVLNGKLQRVNLPGGQEIPGDTMLELDGVACEYRQAVGRTFQNGSVL